VASQVFLPRYFNSVVGEICMRRMINTVALGLIADARIRPLDNMAVAPHCCTLHEAALAFSDAMKYPGHEKVKICMRRLGEGVQ
jgi:hypothetical protein